MGYVKIVLILCVSLSGCAAKTAYRESCGSEVNAAWNELEAAKAKGLAGSVNYTKALGLISLAKSMQTIENFDNCVRHAKKARYYAAQSRKGS
ncbi:MAG: hypothetical protein K6L76_12410 [Agarilytica sp.]